MHVTCAEAIDPDWFEDVATIGLTAGISNLDETIDSVQMRLKQIAFARETLAGGVCRCVALQCVAAGYA